MGRGGSNGRFSGLIELLNQMEWTSTGLKVSTESLRKSLCRGKVTLKSKICNDTLYKPICDSLVNRVKEFLSTN